jgi:hypothetical protein
LEKIVVRFPNTLEDPTIAISSLNVGYEDIFDRVLEIRRHAVSEVLI